MIVKTIRMFTYEDVRYALSKTFRIDVDGVRVCQELGFMCEECPRGQQAHSAAQEDGSVFMGNPTTRPDPYAELKRHSSKEQP